MTKEEAIVHLEYRKDFATSQQKEALDMAISALSAEPCDCISRKEALDAFGLSEKTRKYGGDHSGYDTLMLYEIQYTLEDLPSVQPMRPKGEWIKHENNNLGECMRVSYECSNCKAYLGCEYFIRRSFCPNCGADMRGE